MQDAYACWTARRASQIDANDDSRFAVQHEDSPKGAPPARLAGLIYQLSGAALFAASVSNTKLGIAASELTFGSVPCHLQRSINDAEAAQSRILKSSL
jgi:hypothetical protein